MRLCLMQGKWVWSLIWEESACQGATKLMCHNYRACSLEPSRCSSLACSDSMSIELVMPSNHLILCHPLLLLPSIFLSIRVFSNESVLSSGGQSIGASVSVLPMNIQDWFPLGLTGLISLQSKGLSRVFSNITVQKHQFFGTQLSSYFLHISHPYMTTGKTIALTRCTFVSKVMSLLFNMPSRLVITFLPRNKRLLISWVF